MHSKRNNLKEEILLSITQAPGTQYILVNANEIIQECNAGIADLRNKKPVTSETTFNNFSVTIKNCNRNPSKPQQLRRLTFA